MADRSSVPDYQGLLRLDGRRSSRVGLRMGFAFGRQRRSRTAAIGKTTEMCDKPVADFLRTDNPGAAREIAGGDNSRNLSAVDHRPPRHAAQDELERARHRFLVGLIEPGEGLLELEGRVRFEHLASGGREIEQLGASPRLDLGLFEQPLLDQRAHRPAHRTIGEALEPRQIARRAALRGRLGEIAQGHPLRGKQLLRVAARMQHARDQL